MTQSAKSKSAETGLQSALLYMYAAYTEDGLSPAQAKEEVRNQTFKALDKLTIEAEVETQPTVIKNKGFIVTELRKNIDVLKSFKNVQINYVGKAIEYNLNQLVGEGKLK